MDSFDKAVGDFYRNMTGVIPADDHVSRFVSHSIDVLKAMYLEFSSTDKQEFINNLRNVQIPTEEEDKMWEALTRFIEEETVKEWAGKLGLGDGATRGHVNTAIQIGENIQNNLAHKRQPI